jgi:hypothetical protein
MPHQTRFDIRIQTVGGEDWRGSHRLRILANKEKMSPMCGIAHQRLEAIRLTALSYGGRLPSEELLGGVQDAPIQLYVRRPWMDRALKGIFGTLTNDLVAVFYLATASCRP